jgi:hypothetical protein
MQRLAAPAVNTQILTGESVVTGAPDLAPHSRVVATRLPPGAALRVETKPN